MFADVDTDILANGIYTQRQAAYLARLRPQTVARWFDETEKQGPAVKRWFTSTGDVPVVGFVELIQLMAIRAIRVEHDVSLQKIRQVVSHAESIGFPYPLARNIRIYRLGEKIILKLPNGDYIEASGRFAGHYLMEPIILPYLDDVTFNKDGLAGVYRPSNAAGVILSPKRHWGAPVIETCNYTVASLVNALRAEGSLEAAADMCGVTIEEVKAALRYEDFLRGLV